MKATVTGNILAAALALLLPGAARHMLASASPLPEAAVAPGQGADEGTLQFPPPMWTVRCPREVQDLCTPDNRLFYCTVNGELWNQLSASCSACVCRDASGNGRP